jgi:hypothetical protein
MKIKILFLALILVSYSNASEVRIDTTGRADISGLTFKDKSKYRLYKSNGHWKSSSGDYGLHECFGTLKNDKNNKAQFEVYCKNISQENEYFIIKIYRDTEYQKAGLGKATIVEVSDGYNHLLNATCDHAITYIELDYFAIQKCKL